MQLQEADAHEDEAVARYAAGEDFVEVTVQQELLEDIDQLGQYWKSEMNEWIMVYSKMAAVQEM